MGLLCFIWDQAGQITIKREPPTFVRDFPSSFDRDLHLRAPPRASTSARLTVPLFLRRHTAAVSKGAAAEGAPLSNILFATQPPHPVAVVKSSLQKAIRRGLAVPAVAAAAYLLARDPKELLRRLPVVLVEDVGIFADLPRLMWLCVAVQSGYELIEEDLRFVLTLVAIAAAHPSKTVLPDGVDPMYIDAVLVKMFGTGLLPGNGDDVANVAADTELLSMCLALRACYGGMSCDVEMLLAFAAAPDAWTNEVVPSSTAPRDGGTPLVDEWISDLRCGGKRWGAALAPAEQLDAAVDFHCSDIAPRLCRFLASRGRQVSEEEMKEAMWSLRSSLNFRTPPAEMRMPAWHDAAVDHELVRLSRESWIRPPTHHAAEVEAPSAKRQKPKVSNTRQVSLLRFAQAGTKLTAGATAGA